MSTSTVTESPEIATLEAAVQQWRTEARAKAADRPRPSNDPYGAQLYKLNADWGRTKAEHEAKLDAARQEYLAKREQLTEQSKKFKAETPKLPRGRTPLGDYDDAVKLAVYRASLTHKKGLIRSILGTQDTTKLNRVIAEGKALHDAGEAAQATDGGW